MTRDKSHEKELIRWADYVKNNPKEWKVRLKPFLDAQIIMARRFYQKLSKTEEGRRKLDEIRKERIAKK